MNIMTTMNIRSKQQPQIMIKINQTLIVNIMTTMNIMSKQPPQIMILLKINQTLITTIMTTMSIMSKQPPQSVQEICVQRGFAISAVKRGILYNVQRRIDHYQFLVKICVLDSKQAIMIKTHQHGWYLTSNRAKLSKVA